MQPKSHPIPAANGIQEAGDFPVPQDQDTTNLLTASVKEAQTLYHGSPHIFDHFSTEFIGSGEGGASYGSGLYFASEEAVAKNYQEQGARVVWQVGDAPYDSKNDTHFAAWEIFQSGGDRAAALSRVTSRRDGWAERAAEREKYRGVTVEEQDALVARLTRVVNLLKSRKKIPAFTETTDLGKMYVVNAPEDDRILLWDRPMRSQPPAVKAALADVLEAQDPQMLGKDLYQALSKREGSDEAASAFLLSLGIAGHKYLDQFSRKQTGTRTYNYVLFSAKGISILNRSHAAGKDSSKLSYTPLVYDPKEYAPLKKVWGDQLINELIAAGKPWNNPQVMKRELDQNFFGTFHDIEEAMANLFEEQKDTAFIKKFKKPGTKDIDWAAVASKVVSPNHALPQLFIVAISGAAGDVHVFVRDSRKKKAAYDVPEPQAVDPDNPTPEEEAEWQEWAANRNESIPEPGVVFAAGEELNDPAKVNLTGDEPQAPKEEKAPIDFIDDIVKLVAKKLPAYRTKFRKPLGYREVEKDLVAVLGISEELASLVTPAINLRTDTTLIAPAFKADLMKILKSPKAKSSAGKTAVDHVIEQFSLPTSDAKADKEWDSPYCNNHGNERSTRDSASIESSLKDAAMLSQPALEALRAKTLTLTSEFDALKGSQSKEAEKALDDITAALAVVAHHIDDLTEGLLEKKGAVEQHKEPKKLPPREDMRTHLDKDIRDEIAAEKKENKEGTLNPKSQLLTSHVGTGLSPSSLLRRRR